MTAIRTTLHIGGEKTGTTSLQYFLSWNRDALLKQGILYSAAPGRVNHVLLAIYGSPEVNTEDLKTQVGIGTQSALNAMLSTLPDALEAEVAESGCREILLSNEHCSSRLLSETSVKRIRELIARFSSEVRVVMYLRRQDELLLSAYSTAVSSGRTVPLQIPSGRDLQYYDFAEILDRWAKVFGEENITARVYDPETLVGGDVIDDFVDLIGAKSPPGGLVRPAARLNSSLDSRVTELLRIFNERMPPPGRDQKEPNGPTVVAALQILSGPSGGRLNDREFDDFLRQFDRSNTEVARRFLKRPEGPLFPQRTRNIQPPSTSLDAIAAVKVALDLWLRSHAGANDTMDTDRRQ